jgi:hypothetical protein
MIIDDMNAAIREFVPAFREFHSLMLANPLAKDSDLEGMGFPRRPSARRTPAPVAADPPGYEISPELGHRLRVDFFPVETTRGRAKPAGQQGVEIKWDYAEAASTENPEGFVHSEFATATPATLAFSGSEGGRKVYLALRWVNTRGQKGPWSIAETIVVP